MLLFSEKIFRSELSVFKKSVANYDFKKDSRDKYLIENLFQAFMAKFEFKDKNQLKSAFAIMSPKYRLILYDDYIPPMGRANAHADKLVGTIRISQSELNGIISKLNHKDKEVASAKRNERLLQQEEAEEHARKASEDERKRRKRAKMDENEKIADIYTVKRNLFEKIVNVVERQITSLTENDLETYFDVIKAFQEDPDRNLSAIVRIIFDI